MTDQEKFNILRGLNHVDVRHMYAGKAGNLRDIVLSLSGKELAQKNYYWKRKRELISYFITSEGERLVLEYTNKLEQNYLDKYAFTD